MTSRLMLLSIAPLFAAATAHAQAPGEWSEDSEMKPPPYAPQGHVQTPGYAQPPPVVAPVVAPPRVRKWSIGLNVGQTELTAKNDYEERSATFGTGSLALRYRAWRHLELEFSIGGGSQTVNEDECFECNGEGELAMATGTLAARYRFNPAAKWNWWLLGGIGATTVARKDASDEEVDAAQRPHATLGVGLERRFNRFALQVELRALMVGQTEQEMELSDQGGPSAEGLSGGNFSLGASYYF